MTKNDNKNKKYHAQYSDDHIAYLPKALSSLHCNSSDCSPNRLFSKSCASNGAQLIIDDSMRSQQATKCCCFILWTQVMYGFGDSKNPIIRFLVQRGRPKLEPISTKYSVTLPKYWTNYIFVR